MDEQDRAEMVHRFFSGTGTTYDRIVSLTTLGRAEEIVPGSGFRRSAPLDTRNGLGGTAAKGSSGKGASRGSP